MSQRKAKHQNLKLENDCKDLLFRDMDTKPKEQNRKNHSRRKYGAEREQKESIVQTRNS